MESKPFPANHIHNQHNTKFAIRKWVGEKNENLRMKATV